MKEFFCQQPLIYLITDGEITENNFLIKSKITLQLIQTAVDVGVQLIQMREKSLPARLVFQLTVKAARITKHSNTKLLVNDRADIARAANADGVHLTSSSIPTEIIRQNFPDEFIIGVSAHSIEKAQLAQFGGADFVTYSPIFYSPNKGEPQGVETLRQVCETLDTFPVIVLGGINETNFAETLDAKAKGVAAIRLFTDNNKLPDIVKRIQSFKRENE